MRRIAALLLIPALLLPAACGGGDGKENTAATAAPMAPGEATVTAGTGFGEEPTIKTSGAPPKEIEFKVLKEGAGKPVKSGDVLVANFKGQVWEEGGIALIPFENSFETKSPMVRLIGAGGIIKAWDKKVPGQKVGSRVLLTAPPSEALGMTGNQAAGILPNDTLVFVIDILDSFPAKEAASGAAKTGDLEGLPSIKGTTSPTITVPKNGTPPKALVSKVLIEGKGDAVKDGQFVVVHYTGILWRGGKTFDSSWERAKGSLPVGVTLGTGIIEGWSKGLAGKKLGSRVLLVVPPGDGYGEKGLKVAGITGTDTLVFVVDLLRSY